MCLRKVLVVLLAGGGLLLGSPCRAQVRDVPSDFFRLDKRPFGPVESDLQIFGVGTMLTLTALASENPAQIKAALDEAAMIDIPMDAGNIYGSMWAMGGMTVGLGVFGYVSANQRAKNASWDLGKSLFATAAVVGAIKLAVDRPRPDGSRYSFPSGHTASAFAAAPVLQHHFGWRVGMTAYGLAVFTALGRMEDNRHYLSDVIAGATIGLLTSRYLIRGRNNLSLFTSPQRIGISYDF